ANNGISAEEIESPIEIDALVVPHRNSYSLRQTSGGLRHVFLHEAGKCESVFVAHTEDVHHHRILPIESAREIDIFERIVNPGDILEQNGRTILPSGHHDVTEFLGPIPFAQGAEDDLPTRRSHGSSRKINRAPTHRRRDLVE